MYGQVGRKDDARRILRQLTERKEKRYTHSYCFAWVYEGLGDFEQANSWMNKAIANKEGELVYMKSQSDDLNWANPYFPEWLKKVGFDAAKP